MEYIAYLHKDRASNFGVSFPDFPGCVTAGKTLEEARKLAREALALHIAGMVEDDEEVPAPSSLDEIAKDPEMKKAVVFMVSVEAARDKTVRINIAARESQVEQIDARAKILGLSRSAFLVQSALGQITAKRKVKPEASKAASSRK